MIRYLIILSFILPTYIFGQTTLCPGSVINKSSTASNKSWKLFVSKGQGWEEKIFNKNISITYDQLLTFYSSYLVNGKLSVRVMEFEEKWSGNILCLTCGAWFQISSTEEIYLLRTDTRSLSLNSNDMCQFEVFDFPDRINIIEEGVYTIYQGGTNSPIPNSSQIIDLINDENVNPGSFDLSFEYEHQGCTYTKRVNNLTLFSNPVASFTSAIIDTIDQGDIINITSNIDDGGGTLQSSSGTIFINNNNVLFDGNFADTGWNTFCLTTNTNGCESEEICDSIYVRYIPGVPEGAIIYNPTKGDSIWIETIGKYVSNGFTYVNAKKMLIPLPTYVCRGQTERWLILNADTGNANPADDVTYEWYLIDSNTQTLIHTGPDFSKTFNEANDDSVRVAVLPKNSIGEYGLKTELIVYIKDKPKLIVVDSVCYDENDTVIISDQQPSYFYYPSLMDSNLIDSSYSRKIYINGDSLIGNNIILTNPNQTKLNKVVVKSTYTVPHSRIDTSLLVVTFPSLDTLKWTIENSCQCDFYDTLTYIQKPIASWSFDYIFPQDSIVQHGDLMRFINNSQYASSYYWDFHDGNYTTLVNGSNYVYAGGWHDVTLTANDQYGCSDDTSVFNAYFSASLVDIQEENIFSNIKVYPNPVIDYTTLEFESNTNEIIEVSIINIEGKRLDGFRKSILPGKNRVTLELQGISKGNYTIEIFNGKGKSSIPFIKL